MFKKIAGELHAIQMVLVGLGGAVRHLSDGLREGSEGSADPERLTALEGAIERLRGEMDATIIKAESIRGAARAAEDRGRGHMKRAEAALEAAESIEGGEDIDPFESAARAYAEQLSSGDDETNGGLPFVPQNVEDFAQGLAAVRAAKHGRK